VLHSLQGTALETIRFSIDMMTNIKVPSLDLKAQYQSIKPEIDAAIARVLDSGQFVLGAEVAGFEQEFATYCGAAECIALNSGTSALHLALLAAGVGPGDEVITVPFTFVASVAAVVYTGARPVLVDIDRRSFTMDPAAVEPAISPRTKAILPVHLCKCKSKHVVDMRRNRSSVPTAVLMYLNAKLAFSAPAKAGASRSPHSIRTLTRLPCHRSPA
jgi:DNA-binding transcriptional MocR family regulator